MKRFAMLALVLAFAVSCDDSPTSPSANSNVARFTAILLPTNEVPQIPPTNADAGASGTMQMTMTVTRDSANTITGATYDFAFNVTGFPQNTRLTGAHIHNGPAGVAVGIVVDTSLTSGETLPTGQAAFTFNGVTARGTAALTPAQIAQGIFNNPAGNYFNVHTTVNPGGAVRGQLVRLD
jgi:hypothetical protein